jgi:hypothetical protein
MKVEGTQEDVFIFLGAFASGPLTGQALLGRARSGRPYLRIRHPHIHLLIWCGLLSQIQLNHASVSPSFN